MTSGSWRRIVALIWLAIVVCAAGWLGFCAMRGISLSSDLMALIPREERDPVRAAAGDKVYDALSRQVVILVGHPDRTKARAVAAEIVRRMTVSGLVKISTGGFQADKLKAMGAAYYPHRAGLLAPEDRRLLRENRGEVVAARALAQIYGIGAMSGGGQLAGDPFLLFPRFASSLSLPLSNLALDDGMLSTSGEGKTWVLVAGTLQGAPYGLSVQKRLAGELDAAVEPMHTDKTLSVLRTGAVFFAKAGAETALSETSAIGTVSILFTVLLLIFAFRSPAPLVLSLTVVTVGLTVAAAFSLWVWGTMHVIALLFGVSLIGVTVDYALQYCSEIYVPHEGGAFSRLKAVFSAITLGGATTAVGYATLFLAPFPGLKQIALFSAVGLVSAWVTVVLWLPFLDRRTQAACALPAAGVLAGFLSFWHADRFRPVRIGLCVVLVMAGGFGAVRFHADDDVRKLQSLDPTLAAEQRHIQSLIGGMQATQFFTVSAKTDEAALQAEETLTDRLAPLVADGTLGGFQSAAGFVPSLKRQADNRRLVIDRLYTPYLATLTQTLGMRTPPTIPPAVAPGLTLDSWSARGGGAALSLLRLGRAGDGVVHIVTLNGVRDPARMAPAATGLAGVRLVDPTHDYGVLFGIYRLRAVSLLLVSALLMLPVLMLRYPFRRALAILAPPVAAAVLTPLLTALCGASFTFFDAIALVLVLSMGLDYAVFFAETDDARKTVTLFAILISAATTIMSFGFLAFSSVAAVHNFGLTMLVGVGLSFLLVPLVQWGRECR